MKKFKVGLQLYSVRDAIEKDLYGTLKAVKAMGYDYVESAGAGFYGKTMEEAKAMLNEIGLTLVSAHTKDASAENIAFLKGLGASFMVIPYQSVVSYQTAWDETMAEFTEIGKNAAAAGLRLFYHNHDFEFQKIGDVTILDKMYNELPAEIIAPQFDVCWVTYAGYDAAEYIRKYANKNLKIAHLKDFTCKGAAKGAVYDLIEGGGEKSKEENDFRFRSVGDGVVDFDKVLAACEDAGIEYVIVEQDQSYEVSSLDAVAKSRKYLKDTYGI